MFKLWSKTEKVKRIMQSESRKLSLLMNKWCDYIADEHHKPSDVAVTIFYDASMRAWTIEHLGYLLGEIHKSGPLFEPVLNDFIKQFMIEVKEFMKWEKIKYDENVP